MVMLRTHLTALCNTRCITDPLAPVRALQWLQLVIQEVHQIWFGNISEMAGAARVGANNRQVALPTRILE